MPRYTKDVHITLSSVPRRRSAAAINLQEHIQQADSLPVVEMEMLLQKNEIWPSIETIDNRTGLGGSDTVSLWDWPLSILSNQANYPAAKTPPTHASLQTPPNSPLLPP